MSDKRARLEPPDISEKGGLKGGQPQRSDERLFMQLMAFTGCESTGDVIGQLQAAAFESVLYEDLNDPRGVALADPQPRSRYVHRPGPPRPQVRARCRR